MCFSPRGVRQSPEPLLFRAYFAVEVGFASQLRPKRAFAILRCLLYLALPRKGYPQGLAPIKINGTSSKHFLNFEYAGRGRADRCSLPKSCVLMTILRR